MKIHAPWNAAFDMPYNREQALEVLKAWGSPCVMTFTCERARRVHECLTSETPNLLKAQLKYGSHLEGWAWGDAEGWHGGYETMDEAHQAYLESLMRKGAANCFNSGDLIAAMCRDGAGA